MRILLALIVGLFWFAPAHATTIVAASCSFANVSTATSSAVSGDTVTIPGGDCDWAGNILNISGKSIAIIGNGGVASGSFSSCGGGQTTRTCITGTNRRIAYTPASTGLPRISGIHWLGSCSSCSNFESGIVTLFGSNGTFRFDHNYCNNSGGQCIVTRDYTRGVIDQNWFRLQAVNDHMIATGMQNWLGTDTQGYGYRSWSSPDTLGSDQQIVVENNDFINTLSSSTQQFYLDGQYGTRITVRFNRFTNGNIQWHGFDTSGEFAGGRHMEIYNNTHTCSLSSCFDFGAYRGGSGLFFNNVATGVYTSTSLMAMTTLRRNDTDWSGHRGQYPFGRCGVQAVGSLTRSGTTATATITNNWWKVTTDQGGLSSGWIEISGATDTAWNGTYVITNVSAASLTASVSYTLGAHGTPTLTTASGTITAQSPFDGNTGSTGYRCMGQAGAGQAAIYYTGTGPAFNSPPWSPNPTTSDVRAQNALLPIRCWNNTDDGVESDCWTDAASVIVANRDYYNFNAGCVSGGGCTAGIGQGTSFPTTCTPTATNSGPYFWRTDLGSWNTTGADGVLYQCTAANTWTVSYTPLTYPHPLVGGVDLTPPAAPTGLTIH